MIRAAIVGLGRWGQRLVESTQGKSAKLHFTRGVTRTLERGQSFAQIHGFPLTDDYQAALADPDIDAVVLATPHSQHARQVERAAAAGKHVFVEKPFSLTKTSAEAAVRACEDAGVVLAVGLNRRLLPAMTELRQRATQGALGTLLHVEGNFSIPHALHYAPDSWLADPAEEPAGAMTPLGIHVIDTMIDLFGGISEVQAMSLKHGVLPVDLDDTTSILFRFKNGRSGYLGTIFATPLMWRISVFGTGGWVEMRGLETLVACDIEGRQTTTEYTSIDKEEAGLDAFADAVANGRPYPVPLDQVVHGIAVLEAVIAAAHSGQTTAVA